MEEHKCKNCGSTLLQQGEKLVCRYCGAVYVEDRPKVEDIEKIINKQERERLLAAKKALYDATHAKFPSETAVLNAANEVLRFDPEDAIAQACLYSHDAEPYRLNEFLRKTKVTKPEAGEIIAWVVPSMHYRTVGPMKDFVTRHFKGAELTKFLTMVEDESAKLDDGVYETSLTRDVFLCYSSEDMERVLQVMELLEENGMACFAAFRNLRHGKGAADNYLSLVKNAMKHSRVLVFLSSNASRSVHCDAVKVELPYLIDECPDMPRIQFLLDEPDHVPLLVKRTLKDAFPEQEWCRDEEDLVLRLQSYLTNPKTRSEEAQEAAKKAEQDVAEAQKKLREAEEEKERLAKEQERLRKELEEARNKSAKEKEDSEALAKKEAENVKAREQAEKDLADAREQLRQTEEDKQRLAEEQERLRKDLEKAKKRKEKEAAEALAKEEAKAVQEEIPEEKPVEAEKPIEEEPLPEAKPVTKKKGGKKTATRKEGLVASASGLVRTPLPNIYLAKRNEADDPEYSLAKDRFFGGDYREKVLKVLKNFANNGLGEAACLLSYGYCLADEHNENWLDNSFKWMRKALELGYPCADTGLGFLNLCRGYLGQARMHLDAGVKRGDLDAQCYMAMVELIESDDTLGSFWGEPKPGQSRIFCLPFEGVYIADLLQPCYSANRRAQYDKHVDKAFDLLVKSADQGFPLAMRLLGEFYSVCDLAGRKVSVDEALHWTKKAAQTGDPYAHLAYGMALWDKGSKDTEFRKKNDSEMYQEFCLANECKHYLNPGQPDYWVGKCLLHGFGTQPNYPAAIACWDAGKYRGNKECARALKEQPFLKVLKARLTK